MASHAQTTKRQRIHWIDIAKGIAIILVVVGHTVEYTSVVRDVIFTFHMPLFFIVAGYTFKIKPMGEMAKVSARRLLLPYLVVFFIWQIINYLQAPDAFTLSAVRRLAGMFIFASGSPVPLFNFEMVGMAWFLVCMFCSRLLLNGLLIACRRFSLGFVWQFVMVIALAALGVWLGESLGFYLPFSLDVAMVATALMWVGHFAREIDFIERWGKRWYTVIAALAIYIITISYSDLEMANRLYGIAALSFVGAVAGTLFVCQLSMAVDRYTRLIRRYLIFMGENSLLIYTIHAIDWLIPWNGLAALSPLPFHHGWESLVRIIYASLFAWLVRHI